MAKSKKTDFRYFGYKNSYITNKSISVIKNAYMIILLAYKTRQIYAITTPFL